MYIIFYCSFFLLYALICSLVYGKQLTYSLHDHRAVLDHSVGKELPAVAVESFECLPGRGVAATLSGVKVCVDLIIFLNQQSHMESSTYERAYLLLDIINVCCMKHHWTLLYAVSCMCFT